MKHTENLKMQAKKSDSREIIRKAGMQLNDEELRMVSGGSQDDGGDNTKCVWNPEGPDHFFVDSVDGRRTCIYCGVYF